MSLSSFLFRCTMCWWGRSELKDAGVHGGKHLRKLTRNSVLSKCSADFSASADLASVSSLSFLDGPTGLHLMFNCYSSQKEGNQNGRWGCHCRHLHAMGYMRERHSSGLQWGWFVFSYSRILKGEKNFFWVEDSVLWSSNRLCKDWVGDRHTESRGGFYASYSWPLWAPLYVHLCLLPWHSSYTYWNDLNQDFTQKALGLNQCL